MKKLLFIAVLSMSFALAQKPFDRGNTLYQQAKYEQAIAAYQEVLTNKQHSSELYFNLGNCYYKLNQVAPAIYNYEKALVLNPDDVEIANNLKFAQKLQIDAIKVIPEVGFSKIINNFTSSLHPDTWAGLAIGFGGLLTVFFVGYYFIDASIYKRLFFTAMLLSLLGVFFAIGAAFLAKKSDTNHQPAIIFAAISNLKAEPQNGSATVMVLHEGTKVLVQENLGKWQKVKLTDNTEGWISKADVKMVK